MSCSALLCTIQWTFRPSFYGCEDSDTNINTEHDVVCIMQHWYQRYWCGMIQTLRQSMKVESHISLRSLFIKDCMLFYWYCQWWKLHHVHDHSHYILKTYWHYYQSKLHAVASPTGQLDSANPQGCMGSTHRLLDARAQATFWKQQGGRICLGISGYCTCDD